MVKERTRPQPRICEHSPDPSDFNTYWWNNNEEAELPVAELLLERRCSRQHIDAVNLITRRGDTSPRLTGTCRRAGFSLDAY